MHTTINLHQTWHLGEPLGSGGFGKVYNALSDDGTQVVVKLIPKDPGAKRELLFEDLQEVPNIIPILDTGEWEDRWVLVMPKAEKSLRDRLQETERGLSVEESVQILADIAQALVAIEGRVVHRDIKPENILLLNGHWCLADFGISRYAEATTAQDTRKYAMSSPYAAPEQWKGERATSATDVYSTGVVAYELLNGQRPFAGPEIHDFRRQHLEESPAHLMGIPPKLQSLLIECLVKAHESRPTPQSLLTRLQGGVQPASDASGRLQQVNVLAVQQQAEVARHQSVTQAIAERREELYKVADQSLKRIVASLHDQVVTDAAASNPHYGRSSNWSCALNGVEFGVDSIRMAQMQPNEVLYGASFEVIAYTSVAVQVPPDRYGYKGRSHSLWYCDAEELGVFRWYETAFMSISRRLPYVPMALDPGKESYDALSKVSFTIAQVALRFAPIDQGNERNFVDRWIGWFADAVEGRLCRPNQLPEGNPHGSWREWQPN